MWVVRPNLTHSAPSRTLPADGTTVDREASVEIAAPVATGRWEARPRLALLVRVVAVLIPLVASVVATILISQRITRPSSLLTTILWWIVLSAVASLVALGVERVARRLAPLASLLTLSLAFPDKAAPRFESALRSGTTAELQARLERVRRSEGGSEDPRAIEDLIQLLVALNTHDRRSRGHADRVRAYTDLITDELGLAEDDRQRLSWAAMLHDIGKLSVSADLLNLPRRPTGPERQALQRHAAEGAALVASLRGWLGEDLRAVGEHHERWDGSGYPNRLAGEQISLAGRIVAVADAFDAMTGPKTYQERRSAAEARAELTRAAGSQFDPAVVRAFLNLSIGRLRLVMGPLTWLSNVPVLARMPVTAALGAMGSAVVVGVGAVAGLGALADEPANRPPAAYEAPAGTIVTSDDTPADEPRGDEPRPEEPSVDVSPVTDPPFEEPPAEEPPAEEPPVTVPPPPIEHPAPRLTFSGREDTTITFTVAPPEASAEVDAPPVGSLSRLGDNRFAYRPPADWNGTFGLGYHRCDPDGCGHGNVELTVTPVNDPPSFSAGPDRVVDEDAGTVTVPRWVTGISAGPADESGQSVKFDVVASAPSLFASGPRVTADGTLIFRPARHAHGSATLRVVAEDDGGGAGGGIDRSPGQVASITVRPVPDPPVLDPIGSPSGIALVPITFTATASDADLDGLTFTLESGAGAVPPGATITPAGGFSWTPTALQGGIWTFDVVVTDDSPSLLRDRQTITVTVSVIPEPATGLMVTTGTAHTCHTVADGTARCTGSNTSGQLGTGNLTSVTNTVPVLGPAGPAPLGGVAEVSAGGNSTCAVLTDDSAYCWGAGGRGQLGNGSTADRNRPTRVSGPGGSGFLADVASIDTSTTHTCALLTGGTVYCWGRGNRGELGDGLSGSSTTPVQVRGPGGTGVLSGVTAISVGSSHACAVRGDTTVWCWGQNGSGILGIGSTGGRSTVPVQVVGPGGLGVLTGVAEVSAAQRHTCVRLVDGRAMCWGSSGEGQVGALVPGGNQASPAFVVGSGGVGLLAGVTDVSTGDDFSCAARVTGEMLCWGTDDAGQAGNGPPLAGSDWPVLVAGPGGAGTLGPVAATFNGSATSRTSCAILDDDTLWCWGANSAGQVGDGTTVGRHTPVAHS